MSQVTMTKEQILELGIESKVEKLAGININDFKPEDKITFDTIPQPKYITNDKEEILYSCEVHISSEYERKVVLRFACNSEKGEKDLIKKLADEFGVKKDSVYLCKIDLNDLSSSDTSIYYGV